jgi:hypothetical protein
MRIALTVATALTLAGLVAGCGKSEQLISEKFGPKLVLQPNDVGPRFRRFDVGEQTFTDARRGPRFDPHRFGRTGGWKARYRHAGTVATSGPLVIESRADRFDGVGGAKKDLAAYRDELRSALDGAEGRSLPSPELGDGAVAITFRQGSIRYFRFAWRERNVTGYVSASGFDGRITLGGAERLARKQEARMLAVD